MSKPVPIKIGDIVRLKKVHPCGENRWEVIKTGLDVQLECMGCNRNVRLLRSVFDKRFRGYIKRFREDN